MAHLLEQEQPKPSRLSVLEKIFTIKAPKLSGKFGISLNFGSKEVFIGVAIADIEVEKIVKKRKLPVFTKEKAKTRVFNFS